MSSSVISKLKNTKRIKSKVSISVILLLVIGMILFSSPLESAIGYVIVVDNNVDGDSNIDSSANIGTDGVTDYTDAQTLDGSDQVIVEADEGGGGSPMKAKISALTSTPESLSISHYVEGVAIAHDGSVMRGVETYKDYSGTWRSDDEWGNEIYNTSRIEEVESSYNETSDDYDEYAFVEQYTALSGNFKVIFQETNTRIIGDGWEFIQRPNRMFLYNWETEAIVGSQDVERPSDWGYVNGRIRYDNIFANTNLFFGYNGSDLKEVFRASTIPENYPNSPWSLDDSYLVIDTLITNQSGFNMADDNGDITINTTVIGRLKLLDQYDQVKAFMPMGTAWAWFDETQSNQTVDIRSRLKNINGEWHLYSAIEYELFNHALRDGDVFIDPTWTIGDQGGDSWSDCEFNQTMENTTTNHAQLYPSNSTGDIISPINEAYRAWVRISYQGITNGQTVDIYWNSSTDNGVSDPFTMSLVQSSASPNVDYYFSQEKKFGGWKFVLSTDNTSESPLIYNITVNNDGSITNTGSAWDGDYQGTSLSVTHGLTINEDDVVIAMMHQNTALETFSDDNGIYPFTEAYADDGEDTHHYAIYYRVAGASEPATYSFSTTRDDDWSLIIRVFSGVNTTDVFDVAPSAATQNSYADYSQGQTLTVDEITIVKAGAVGIIYCFSDTGQTNVYSNPTNGYDNYTGATAGWPSGSFLKTHTTGATGSTSITQTKTQDWTVNHFALKLADVPATENYMLEWEHQVSSPAVDIHKDRYILTIYGFSSGSVSENFTIQMFNPSTLVWDSALSVQISTTEQWYNQTIDYQYVDTSNNRITWIYNDTDQTDDTDQSTLNIDYAGVRAYNISIYGLPDNHDSLSFSPDSEYHNLSDSPFSFVVESGEIFDLQIKGVDGTGSPVSSGYLYWNTVDNTGTATVLTTSWVNFLTSQSAGNTTYSVYLWVNYGWEVDDPELNDISPTYTLNITISSI